MGVLAAFAVTALLVLRTAPVFAYSGLFVTDAYATYAKLLILAGGALTAVLALDYNERNGIGRFEFPVLMLFSTVGMMVMASANSLMSLYMGLELQSLAIYVLCAFARDDVRSSEAGLKYFVLSALASGLLLYGISLTYGFSGTMDFGRLAQIVTDPAGVSTGLVVGIAFVIAGLAFKLSAVPFHMWTPDVYEGAPTPVTAFMSTAPKVAPFVVLLRVMIGPFGHVAVQWQPIIYVVSIGSMLLGSFAAIGQTNIKRLMAYSSIGHMGLRTDRPCRRHGDRPCAACSSTCSPTLRCRLAPSRASSPCAATVGRSKKSRTSAASPAPTSAWQPCSRFSCSPWPACHPSPAFSASSIYSFLRWRRACGSLAVLGVLTSVVGLFYYLRVIKVMFFDAAEPAFDKRSASVSFVALATGAFTVFFLFALSPFTTAAGHAAKVLFG